MFRFSLQYNMNKEMVRNVNMRMNLTETALKFHLFSWLSCTMPLWVFVGISFTICYNLSFQFNNGGPLSLVSTTEELLEIWEYGRRDPSGWPRGTLYPQKLALTSSTGGGCSVSMVRSWTQTAVFFLFFFPCLTTALTTIQRALQIYHGRQTRL
jgi:hypothetical protein